MSAGQASASWSRAAVLCVDGNRTAPVEGVQIYHQSDACWDLACLKHFPCDSVRMSPLSHIWAPESKAA